MDKETYIRSVLETNFSGFKDEIIDTAVKKIAEYKEPEKEEMTDRDALKIFAEIQNFCAQWGWNSQTFANALEKANSALCEKVRRNNFGGEKNDFI